MEQLGKLSHMLLPSGAHPTRALSSWLLGTGTRIPLMAHLASVPSICTQAPRCQAWLWARMGALGRLRVWGAILGVLRNLLT